MIYFLTVVEHRAATSASGIDWRSLYAHQSWGEDTTLAEQEEFRALLLINKSYGAKIGDLLFIISQINQLDPFILD